MNDIFSLPVRAYNHVHQEYGMIGVIVAGLLLVVGVISLIFWFDRRK